MSDLSGRKPQFYAGRRGVPCGACALFLTSARARLFKRDLRRAMLDQFRYVRRNGLGLNRAQTLDWFFEMAGIPHARRARQRVPQYDVLVSVRARAPWISRAEQRHHGTSQCGGDMHGSGVIRHQRITSADPFDHLGK